LLLARLGARVVVNDLGGSRSGEGADHAPAADVAGEIVASGGAAVADANDVSSPASARALVDTALEHFGRVDVLVNNAGIIQWTGMPDVDEDAVARHFAVHVEGSFNTARAAWPHLVEQQYGRIVMTTSSGVFGLRKNLAYATAKGGIIGLTRSLATEGAAHDILVNAVAPAAFTRMAGPGTGAPEGSPDSVAPMVAFLAHETCPVTGEMYTAGFGRFARLFLAMTPGYASSAEAPTVEHVAEHWAEINDEAGYSVPVSLDDWSKTFMRHLRGT
jgi:NAD(P)-dependent dehydrogenase (short-subunit alcohol dehydrogenase family)